MDNLNVVKIRIVFTCIQQLMNFIPVSLRLLRSNGYSLIIGNNKFPKSQLEKSILGIKTQRHKYTITNTMEKLSLTASMKV